MLNFAIGVRSVPVMRPRRRPRFFVCPMEIDERRAHVAPNKFAALSPDCRPERTIHRSRRSMGGFGEHDVIVETPDHSLAMAQMTYPQVADILRIHKIRYDQLSLDPGLRR